MGLYMCQVSLTYLQQQQQQQQQQQSFSHYMIYKFSSIYLNIFVEKYNNE